MRSKRDQVQAHTFMMGRLTAGMLLADPDAPESPLGRTTRGALIGVVVGALVCGGAVVFGLLKPGGNDSWRGGDTLIVNKDTGARYLYVGGRLRPVRNYASAMLIGGSDLKTTTVGSASLEGTPVGRPVGITGAPDTVPGGGNLEDSAWEVCSAGTGTTTALVPGAPLENEPVGEHSALVVRGPDRRMYLVWQGSRLELDDASGAAESLGYGAVKPRPVSAAFLNALVSGPKLATLPVREQGAQGPELGGRGTRVGQVFRVVAGSGSQEYVLQKDGLHPVTATQSALLVGDPGTRKKAYAGQPPKVVTIGVSDLRAHQAPGTTAKDPSVAGLPDSPPRAARTETGQAVCAQVDSVDGRVRVRSVRVAESALSPVTQPDPTALTAACVPVNGVVMRPGHGTLVRALGAAGAPVGDTTFLVSDDGVKYRIPNSDALTALGYDEGSAVRVPSTLLSMLPTGPELDPAAAASESVTPVAAGSTARGRAAQCESGPAKAGTAVAGEAKAPSKGTEKDSSKGTGAGTGTGTGNGVETATGTAAGSGTAGSGS
ncbi:type VII secretion protein EccB [Streptomyces griseoaurantiacus]|uniref:type VII secretion protein EccB n=1 Tax=Streptomyces griseoaurantiacus TaxID=68213 RepID=UPI0034612929